LWTLEVGNVFLKIEGLVVVHHDFDVLDFKLASSAEPKNNPIIENVHVKVYVGFLQIGFDLL